MKLFTSRLVLLGTLTLVLAACGKSAPPANGQRPPPEVEVVSVHAKSVPLTRVLVGRLAATRVGQVRARVAGVILKQLGLKVYDLPSVHSNPVNQSPASK